MLLGGGGSQGTARRARDVCVIHLGRAQAAGGPPCTGSESGRGSPVDEHFSLGSRREGRTLRLALEGELDRSAVGEVEGELAKTWDVPTDHVVLDLSNVSFLDSAGLKALLRAKHRAREGHLSMAVVRPRGRAGRIFPLTRAGRVLPSPGE